MSRCGCQDGECMAHGQREQARIEELERQLAEVKQVANESLAGLEERVRAAEEATRIAKLEAAIDVKLWKDRTYMFAQSVIQVDRRLSDYRYYDQYAPSPHSEVELRLRGSDELLYLYEKLTKR